ncbi:hypothetical protein ILYODFUR_016495 [Ilyodon furcidens]|uniref:Uncharacterized protein n=1 Tax=Ilyodon furcidens TaxID=33524 RepID=A0ABV0UUT7_9TELE
MFSKWVEAFPRKQADSSAVAKALFSEIIPRWGIPQVIKMTLTDNQDGADDGSFGASLSLCLCILCVYMFFEPQYCGLGPRFCGLIQQRGTSQHQRVLSRVFFTIFHQSELHRTPDEQSRSTLRDTPPKASEGKACWHW